MTFIVTHLINGSAFHVDSQLTPPSGTKTSWPQLQVLRSHSIFIIRGIHEIIHKKRHRSISSPEITEESCQEREEQAAYGSVVRKLLIEALQWTASPSRGRLAGTRGLHCTDHVMRFMSDIYQTWIWSIQSHQLLTMLLRASSIHHPTLCWQGTELYIRKASGSPLFIAFNKNKLV